MTPGGDSRPAGLMGRLRGRLRDGGHLRRWLVLGTVIGIVAGLSAIAFVFALRGSSRLLLKTVGGYTPPMPTGEGGSLGTGGFERPWAVPLVVAFGGLVSGVLAVGLAMLIVGDDTIYESQLRSREDPLAAAEPPVSRSSPPGSRTARAPRRRRGRVAAPGRRRWW